MTLVTTDALVLHAFDYRETSRIIRLVTRERGVVSVIARGARRPKNAFGAALDLFASGTAQFKVSFGRELHALTAFEATQARSALAGSMGRFAGASALCELLLRFAPEDQDTALLDAATDALDALAVAPAEQATGVTLGGAWTLIAALGFAPSLDACVHCHATLPPGEPIAFHHRAGGALCGTCARQARGARTLPVDARDALRGWLRGQSAAELDTRTARAHQRLLREFLEEHLTDGRPLKAMVAWERQDAGA